MANLKKRERFSANPASHNNVNHCFLATGVVLSGNQTLDPGENIEVVLMPYKDAIDLARKGSFFQGLHVAAFFLAMEHVQSLTSMK